MSEVVPAFTKPENAWIGIMRLPQSRQPGIIHVSGVGRFADPPTGTHALRKTRDNMGRDDPKLALYPQQRKLNCLLVMMARQIARIVQKARLGDPWPTDLASDLASFPERRLHHARHSGSSA